MVELGSGIGVEDYLTVMPVVLADVADVENTHCMMTILYPPPLSPVGLRRTPPKSGGVRWDSGGTLVESSGKQGVGGCWVSLGPKFGPELKFEPELLRTRSKFSPKFSILLN